jgi:hypothetical protein
MTKNDKNDLDCSNKTLYQYTLITKTIIVLLLNIYNTVKREINHSNIRNRDIYFSKTLKKIIL